MNIVFLVALILSVCLIQDVSSAELKKDPTYIVVAPNKIRPNQLLRIGATVLKMEYETFTVVAIVRKLNQLSGTYDEISNTRHTFNRPGTSELSMRTQEKMSKGNYTLRVAGYSDINLEGQIFSNDTELFFDGKEVSVFIQLSKPFYSQGQTVRLRVIPVETNLKAVSTTMDIKIKDPNGFAVREFFSQHTNAGGVVSLAYPLSSNILSYGDWTVEVYCREQLYNKTFRVQEFYEPLFYVNVSMPTTMLKNGYGISGIVSSNHTTGRGTKGDCTVRLDVLSMADDDRAPKKTLIRNIPYFDGRVDFLFTRQEMGENPNTLVGKELRVTASVRDWFYNTTAEGYQSAIVYDEDVEIKFLGSSVWSFKPNLPFNIFIAAIKRDGSPLDPNNENRTIYLDIVESREGIDNLFSSDIVEISTDTSIAEYWLYPKSITTRILVTARYMNKQDTLREFVATKFWSPNDYYIQLSTPTKRPTVGQYMIFNVKTNTFIESVFYHIVAAGNIIITDKVQMYSRNKLFSIALSREMAPNARIIAYFVAPDGQMVVDSLNFHVNGSQLHEMSLRFNRGKDFSYNSVEITATADPLSYVAFSAIEYQLYELGARNGLTWEEVTQEMYSYDMHANTSIQHYWMRNGQLEGSFHAPTPSYAHDANSTFFFAGLYVYTDANASAVYTSCNKTEGMYPCMDGITCYDFKDICTDKPQCPNDRRDEMGCYGNVTYNIKLYDDDALWRTKHISPFFPDGSFLWEDQFTKPDGRIDFKVDVPTFPTTWVVTGFSMSLENGLAILPVPTQFDGVRPMYITVQAASHARTGEHMSLRVVIFNFWNEAMDVLITLDKSEDYQFVSINLDSDSRVEDPVDGSHQLLVPVFPGGNRQVYIPLRPRKVGHLAIPVRAFCVVGGHTVIHHVYVDYYGVPEHYITNRQVDLRQANSERLPDLLIPSQEALVEPEIRIQNYVPDSPQTKIYVIGDVVGISFFPYVDYDLTSENLLRQPYGTGAEAIFNFAINLATLKMLRALATVSNEDVNRVVYTLNIAMQEMMFYIQDDGSFKEFRWSDKSSTWLTALGLQALSEGRDRTNDLFQTFQVPTDAMSNAAIWLSKQQDKATGAFHEVNYVYNRRFQSTIDVEINSPDGVGKVTVPANMSLTALCVAALAQTGELSKEASEQASAAKLSGATYLETHIRRVEDPFELSLSIYALMKAGKQTTIADSMSRLNAKNITVNGMMYWSTEPVAPIVEGSTGQDTTVRRYSKEFSNVTAYAVSATSYALLCNMDYNAKEGELSAMQKFLQEQHMWVGGFASTQDTLVAMQALKKLSEKNQDRSTYEMSFTFESDQDQNWKESFTLDQTNWFQQKVVNLPTHWGSIKATVKGHGVALVQMETTSNHEHRSQLRTGLNPNIFSLGDYNQRITTTGFNHSIIDYQICPSYHGGGRSGMSVLEVGLPSGYIVHNITLQQYVRSQQNLNTTLRNAESYSGKAVFYFDYLDQTDELNCAKFRAVRWFPVSNMTEHNFLRVFEYYEPGNFNYTFYEKVEFRSLTVCLTCGSYQCPYCPHYAAGTWVTPNMVLTVFSILILMLVNNPVGVDHIFK